MKKILSAFFIFIVFSAVLGLQLFNNKIKVKAENISNLSKSSILIDYDSGNVILSKNEEEKMPIASMCKIMTLLLCFEQIDSGNLSLQDEVIISEKAHGMGGSQVYLEENGVYAVSELLKSIIVASANDSCVAMAEKICNNEQDFVDKMNQKAKELKMENTNFTNCTGLPKVGQYSCAKDVSIMFRELLKHDDYFLFSKVWTENFKHPQDRTTLITNTNKLIRFYKWCDGGKTGYTSEAGFCLAATAKKDNLRLISIVINSPSSKDRFKETTDNFDYGFNNFTNKLLIDCNKNLDDTISVLSSKNKNCSIRAEKSVYYFTKKDQKVSFEIKLIPDKNLKAPISKDEKVGILEIYKDNVLYDTVNVLANEEIYKKDFNDYFNEIVENWAL